MTSAEELAFQDKLTEWGLAPVPERVSTTGELAALLVMVTLPEACGEKVTLKEALWPAARVSGKPGPLTLKPVPVADISETVSDVLPVFARLPASAAEFPTVTVPKSTLAGLTLSMDWRPVPESETVVGELTPLLINEMLPLASPLDFGEKTALMATLSPAGIASGKEGPLMLKPVPVTCA